MLQVVLLTIQLGKKVDLPKRNTRGNLLNILFLFFIGVIERLEAFEHGKFKMTSLFQSSMVRKSLMLLTCLLFFLTSYEQPITFPKSVNEVATVKGSDLKIEQHISIRVFSKRLEPFACFYKNVRSANCSPYHYTPFKRTSEIFLQNRCFLI